MKKNKYDNPAILYYPKWFTLMRGDMELREKQGDIPPHHLNFLTQYATHISNEEVKAAYDACYENETFVRVLDKDVCPQTKWVEGSNYVDVNFKIDPRTHRIIMMGAIDNLVKGAAGQAVQNMNLMFGFDEAEGLLQVPMYP